MIHEESSDKDDKETQSITTKDTAWPQSKNSSAEYKRFKVKSTDEAILERVLELERLKTQIRSTGGFNHPIFII